MLMRACLSGRGVSAYWCLGDVVGEEGRAFCGRELGTYVRIQACGFICKRQLSGAAARKELWWSDRCQYA